MKLASGDVDIKSYTDYYIGGWAMPARQTASSQRYRSGYQGQFAENDAETGLNSFELRGYDPRKLRWDAPDPYRQHHSSYMAMGNNWGNYGDSDGGFDTKISAWWWSLWHGGGTIGFNGDNYYVSQIFTQDVDGVSVRGLTIYAGREGKSWDFYTSTDAELYSSQGLSYETEMGGTKFGVEGGQRTPIIKFEQEIRFTSWEKSTQELSVPLGVKDGNLIQERSISGGYWFGTGLKITKLINDKTGITVKTLREENANWGLFKATSYFENGKLTKLKTYLNFGGKLGFLFGVEGNTSIGFVRDVK